MTKQVETPDEARGVSTCFAINAATFLVMIAALRLMDPRRCARRTACRGAGSAALRARLRRADAGAEHPARDDGPGRDDLLQLPGPAAAAGAHTWHGTATTYAMLTASMGVGSVSGALARARGRVSPRLSCRRVGLRARRAAGRAGADPAAQVLALCRSARRASPSPPGSTPRCSWPSSPRCAGA